MKLQTKERNMFEPIPGTVPTHHEYQNQMRTVGEKTWRKGRHYKKTYAKSFSKNQCPKVGIREYDLLQEEADDLHARAVQSCI